MRKVAVALGLLAGSYASGAMAQTAVGLSLTAPEVCALGSVVATASGTGTLGGTTVTFAGNSNVGTATALLADAAGVVLTWADSPTVPVQCNNASGVTVKLKSANQGLKIAATPTVAPIGTFAPFTLPYIADVTWFTASDTTELDSDKQAAGTDITVLSTTAAIHGDFVLTVNLDDQTAPLVEGTYTDTLTITITAL